MPVETRTIEYAHDGRTFEGLVAWDSSRGEPRPGVLVCHAWGGAGDFEFRKARALAELGYVGFCIDLYGKGRRGSSREENARLMQPLLEDRQMLQQRLAHSLVVAREQPQIDDTQMAAIGFCFGGLCALDLARTGSDVKGVVSFHGLFVPPGNTGGTKIRAKVLALHGWDDPMAPPEQVRALGDELTAAGADWQIHAYGNTMHSFTNPNANDPDNGLRYDATADRRSWRVLQSFLDELFG